jgi:hypothetical protein
MAEACAPFQELSLRAAAAEQHSRSAGLQPMQQAAGWTPLDVALQAARQEAPAVLRRWWEQQLASNRVQTLQDEIAKWERNTQTLHGDQAQGRERLRKLRAVQAAIRDGDLPPEMLTVHGWSAVQRERQQRELDASAQARAADTSHLQRTPPLQNGDAACWVDRVGRCRGCTSCTSPYVCYSSTVVSTHQFEGYLVQCATVWQCI